MSNLFLERGLGTIWNGHVTLKDVLTNHNCLEAFWVGILKNRDLQVRRSSMATMTVILLL